MPSVVISHPCGHCGRESVVHNVRYAYDMPGDRVGGVCECPACKAPSAFVMYGGEAHAFNQLEGDALENYGWVLNSFSPRREPPEIPPHLPEAVEIFYRQAGENSIRRGMTDAAVLMCRRAIEAAAVDFGETEGPLAKRLRRLAERGVLTAAMADWAHHIRVIGNEAAHGEPLADAPHADDIATETLDFTRLLLMYLYTLPGMIQAARKPADDSAAT